MQSICVETSHLISVVNDEFVSSGWKPVGGNAVMWDRSNHYGFPHFWLPYFQQRLFTTKDDFSKGVGINILFNDPYGGISNTVPFISCSFIQMKENCTLKKCDEIYSAGWNESSTLISGNFKNFYKTTYPTEISVINYFLPLEALTGQPAVKDYIINPLKLLYQGKIDETYDLVKRVCLSKEQLST